MLHLLSVQNKPVLLADLNSLSIYLIGKSIFLEISFVYILNLRCSPESCSTERKPLYVALRSVKYLRALSSRLRPPLPRETFGSGRAASHQPLWHLPHQWIRGLHPMLLPCLVFPRLPYAHLPPSFKAQNKSLANTSSCFLQRDSV